MKLTICLFIISQSNSRLLAIVSPIAIPARFPLSVSTVPSFEVEIRTKIQPLRHHKVPGPQIYSKMKDGTSWRTRFVLKGPVLRANPLPVWGGGTDCYPHLWRRARAVNRLTTRVLAKSRWSKIFQRSSFLASCTACMKG